MGITHGQMTIYGYTVCNLDSSYDCSPLRARGGQREGRSEHLQDAREGRAEGGASVGGAGDEYITGSGLDDLVSDVCQMCIRCASDVCQMCVRCVSDVCPIDHRHWLGWPRDRSAGAGG